MNTKIFAGCLFAASMLFTTSCSDFLTEDPKGKITPDKFYTNQSEVDMAVHGLYAMIQAYQANSNPMIMQCQGDDVTSSNNKPAYLSSDAFEVPSDDKGLNDGWSRLYKIIYTANDILKNVPNAEISQESKNLAMGQAYYWRAFSYYSLVRLFGPVPMNLDNTPDNNQSQLMDVKGVYDQIINDLVDAEKCNLPKKYEKSPQQIEGQNVYVSQQAVKSTMAAVYMSMAGYPMKETKYYEDAAKKALEVIEGGYDHNLLTDWNEVYSYGKNHHEETILGIDYNSTPGGWSDADSQFSSCHQFASLGGWGDFLPERKFWANFPEGPRKDAIYSQKIMVKEPKYEKGELKEEAVLVDWWATKDGKPFNHKSGEESNAVISEYRPMFVPFTVNKDPKTGAFIKGDYDYNQPFWAGMCIDKRHQLIRYSEVLLWYAESAARAGMDLTKAKEALKTVRERAYADNSKVSEVDAMDAATLAEAAYMEHGYEVAGYVLAMVTRRSDEFRMERLKDHYDFRTGDQKVVIVPKGTDTQSMNAEGKPFTYKLQEDLVIKEDMAITASWNGESSIYHNYPPKEVEKNPNLKR